MAETEALGGAMPNGSAGLDKGIDLFLAIANDTDARPLSDHARALGIPLSTARRVSAAFERRGMLMKADKGHRIVGPALSRLIGQVDPVALLAAASRPFLRRCARRLQQTVHLGIFEADMVTYIVKEQGGRTELFTRERMQLEAYCSAIGRVLLAHMPVSARDAYLDAGPFVALTDRTVTDPVELRRTLASIADIGHAVDDREIAVDLHCVALPVRDHRGNVIAAMSASLQLGAPDDPHVARRLEELASCRVAMEQRLAFGCRPA